MSQQDLKVCQSLKPIWVFLSLTFLLWQKLIRANLPNGVTKIPNEPLSKPEAIQYVLAEKIAVDWGIILDFIDDEQGRHTLENGSVEETLCKIIRSGRAVIPASVCSSFTFLRIHHFLCKGFGRPAHLSHSGPSNASWEDCAERQEQRSCALSQVANNFVVSPIFQGQRTRRLLSRHLQVTLMEVRTISLGSVSCVLLCRSGLLTYEHDHR